MYEITLEECERRLERLDAARSFFESKATNTNCQCERAAQSQLGTLLARLHANDTSALDELLKFYSGCIGRWASLLYPIAADHVVFKSELVVFMIHNSAKLTENNFSNMLHAFAAGVASAEHQHVLEWHQRNLGEDTDQTGVNGMDALFPTASERQGRSDFSPLIRITVG